LLGALARFVQFLNTGSDSCKLKFKLNCSNPIATFKPKLKAQGQVAILTTTI